MLSDHERRVWFVLAEVLGGFGRVSEIAGRRLSSVVAWRCGLRRPSFATIDRLIEAVADQPVNLLPGTAGQRVRLMMELRRWREDSVARKAASTAKLRQVFLQRFGHLPDDPAWQRRKKRDGDAVIPVKPGRSGIPRSRDRRDF
jgi:hypothetical protein